MESIIVELNKINANARRIESKLKKDSVLEKTLRAVKRGLENKIKEVQSCTA